jgi:hypothetical protein
MKNKFVILGMLAAALTFGVISAGCDNGTSPGPGGGPSAAEQFRDAFNALYPGSVTADGAYVTILTDLTLTDDVSVPSGVTLLVSEGKALTVDAGKTLNITDGSLVLSNDTTFTVNGTVNAKGTSGPTGFGIIIAPGAAPTATINGSGIIHLKTQGILLTVMAGQTLTLSGTITLDGLTIETSYPGASSTDYPSGIGGDPMNNNTHLVFVAGTLNMDGGTIIGNYNTNSTQIDGGGVEVNKEDGGNGAAIFTMSGDAKVSGNKAVRGDGGVNVCKGGTFLMNGGTIGGNSAAYAGGVRVYGSDSTFTMSGGTIYGSKDSDEEAPLPNIATDNHSASLNNDGGTVQYGDSSPIMLDQNDGKGTNANLTGKVGS